MHKDYLQFELPGEGFFIYVNEKTCTRTRNYLQRQKLFPHSSLPNSAKFVEYL